MGRPTKLTADDTVQHRETAKHHAAFEAWYTADRDFGEISQNLSINDRTLRHWADWFGWRARADERDSIVEQQAAKAAIKRKAEMIERHRRGGELAHKRGMEYLSRNTIADERAALSALKIGSEMERTAEGLPAWVIDLLGMNDAELHAYIQSTAGALAAGDHAAIGATAGADTLTAEEREGDSA
ncbi:MAG: hypothetical protein LC793_11115 [Thermomicrobia bacterium]|nr:hypothetical protein [Thermomicrobia bacterium]